MVRARRGIETIKAHGYITIYVTQFPWQKILTSERYGKSMAKGKIKVLVIGALILGVLINSSFTALAAGDDNFKTTQQPIKINDNSEMVRIAEDQGWAGNGSAENPYIISGYTINAAGYGYGIFIGNTTLHFVIENCSVSNASFMSWPYSGGSGIMLYNVENGTVKNVTSEHNSAYGIWIDMGRNNTLIDNSVKDNGNYGVLVSYSYNNSIYGTVLQNNSLALWGDKKTFTTQNIPVNNTLNGNSIYYIKNVNIGGEIPNTYGELILGNVTSLTVSSLNMSGITVGIIAGYSSNITVKNSKFSNMSYGILTFNLNNSKIINNTFNGDSGAIYTIFSNSDLISGNSIQNCTFSGIYLNESNNNTVTGNRLINDSSGIWIYGASENIIANNTVMRNQEGIIVSGGRENEIANNSIANCSAGGIYLKNTENNLVENSQINNTSNYGIKIDESQRNVILNNSISFAQYGIKAYGYSENNSIINNKIYLIEYGIGIQWHSSSNNIRVNTIKYANESGIYIESSTENTIINNTIDNCGNGTVINYANNNILEGNIIEECNMYGVVIESGSGNQIYLNYFYYNNRSNGTYNDSRIQAWDDGYGNLWNSTYGIGNYWYDWANNNNTNDRNNDSIVDWPYHVGGSAKGKDYYPLKNASTDNVLTHPLYLRAKAGSNYVNITWQPPKYGVSEITGYRIYRNGNEIAEVNSTRLWFNDTSVVSGQTYMYYVTAVGVNEESTPSNEIQVTPGSDIPELSAIWIVILFMIAAIAIKRHF